MISFDVWRGRFAGCEPVGYRLRDVLQGRWVRFHSLPESKRYPTNTHEYAVLLERHNTILGALTAPGQRVVLVTTEYSDSPESTGRDPLLEELDPGAVHWRTATNHEVDGEDDGEPPWYWHFHTSLHVWWPGLFDPIVRRVANDETGNVLIVDPACRWLLYPYDGGMDVIAESRVARDRLKAAHPDWLSSHPDGL